jgi:hypothetical protein
MHPSKQVEHHFHQGYPAGFLNLSMAMLASCCACAITISAVVVIVTFASVLPYLAQTAVDDSFIALQMTLSDPDANSFHARVQGSIDNRGHFAARLMQTELLLRYKGSELGVIPFPQLDLLGASVTALDISQRLRVTNRNVFIEFSVDLLASHVLQLEIQGTVNAKAMNVIWHSLRFRKMITIIGFADFVRDPPRILNLSVNKGMATTIVMTMDVEVDHTGSVAFENTGRLNLTCISKGDSVANSKDIVLGYAIASRDVMLGFGTNKIQFDVFLERTAESEDRISDILGNFAQGLDSYLVLKGHNHTTENDFLKQAFSTVALSSIFPAQRQATERMFQEMYTVIDTGRLVVGEDQTHCNFTNHHWYNDVHVFLHNPLNLTFTLTHVNLDVTFEGLASAKIGPSLFAVAKQHYNAVVLPPGATVPVAQRLCVSDGVQVFDLLTFFSERRADITGVAPFLMKVTVEGYLYGHADEYLNIRIPYKQTHVDVITRLEPRQLEK